MSQPESATCNRQEISRNPQPDAGLSARQRQPSSYCQFSGAPPYHLPFAAESRAAGGDPDAAPNDAAACRSRRAGGSSPRAGGGDGGRGAPAGERVGPRLGSRARGGREEPEPERFAWGSEVILGGPASVARLITPRTCPINPRGSW